MFRLRNILKLCVLGSGIVFEQQEFLHNTIDFLSVLRNVKNIPSENSLSGSGVFINPFIGKRTLEHEMKGRAFERPAWGIMGLSIEEAKPFIGRREEAVKTTPISTLDPLIGWSEQEIDGLMKHFLDPSKNRIHPSIGEWIT